MILAPVLTALILIVTEPAVGMRPHFYGGWTDSGKHVPTGWLVIDELLFHADLRKKIVDISPVIVRLREHRDLCCYRVTAADTVDVQGVTGACYRD